MAQTFSRRLRSRCISGEQPKITSSGGKGDGELPGSAEDGPLPDTKNQFPKLRSLDWNAHKSPNFLPRTGQETRANRPTFDRQSADKSCVYAAKRASRISAEGRWEQEREWKRTTTEEKESYSGERKGRRQQIIGTAGKRILNRGSLASAAGK